MKWEDFKNGQREHLSAEWSITDIECPKCGRKLHRYEMAVLTSLPPKRKYKCFTCDWEGTA